MIRIGRWRVEVTARVQVWRVRRRGEVVLWGARDRDVAFGSHVDRVRQLENRIMGDMLRAFQRELLHASLFGQRAWGGVTVVPLKKFPDDMAIMVSPGSAIPIEGLASASGIEPALPEFEWISDVDADVQPFWSAVSLNQCNAGGALSRVQLEEGMRGWARDAGMPDPFPERDRQDELKLRAYSGARGWTPDDGDQA